MKHLAIVLLVVACGKSDKGRGAGADSGSWKIGDIEVPNAAIPQKLDVPTVLPKKIGDELIAGELFEMNMVIPEKLNVSYVLGEHPNDDLVRGYKVMIYADPVPDLEAKWGAATEKSVTGYGLSRCWTAADKQLEACVPKGSGQGPWVVLTTTTAAPPDRPITPVPPEPAGAYDDFPVGVGPCIVAGIQEISQIVGKQLQYLQPEPDNTSCNLVPATDKAASRTSRQVTASEAIAAVPDVMIMRQDASLASWSAFPIEGLGDKATWEDMSVQFQVKALMYRVRVTDPTRKVRWLKDRALQIARKVAARAAALPQ